MSSFKNLTCSALIDLLNLSVQALTIDSELSIAITFDLPFKAFNKALKTGGILGVVEHRLPEHRADEDQKSSGYMKQSYVIEVAKKAGFELVEASEINANPLDSANHPKGVWTLPPRLALGEEKAEQYKAIGESDRMTLKFKKL